MAKPRVFVSSTYYDLKHVRSSLEIFIESLGYEAILSEKGDIAFTPDTPLDESCYREAATADVLVLIVGGRYGMEASSKQKQPARTFFERYDSITKKEYETAASRDVPIYILIEANVYSEYQTYLRNKDRQNVVYAHVDSVNIFKLIEEILSKPRNNPIHTFERFADIEAWLREQWAGMFRELLQRQSQQQQLRALTTQVADLRQINETLRKYLEAVMTGIGPDASTKLIESEQKRLQEIERNEAIKRNSWCSFVTEGPEWDIIPFGIFLDAMQKAQSFFGFTKIISRNLNDKTIELQLWNTLKTHESARKDFNDVRQLLGLKQFRLSKKQLGDRQ